MTFQGNLFSGDYLGTEASGPWIEVSPEWRLGLGLLIINHQRQYKNIITNLSVTLHVEFTQVQYIAGVEITAGQWTMSRLIGELTGQPFVLPVMLTGHIWSYWKWNVNNIWPCLFVGVSCRTLIWNHGWNATRTIVYNMGIETDIGGSHTSGHKIKNIFTFISLYSRWIQIFFPCNGE